MQSASAQAYFRDQFQQDLEHVGADLLQQYKPILTAYQQIIIPFERKRVNEHQSIIFQNSSLEQNKLELMGKIERCKSDNEKLQNALEMQRSKLIEYQKRLQEMDQLNNDNLSVIESLRIRNEDYKNAIDSKNASIVQLQKDKALVLEKFQDKDKEYNLVLANCMRDKNLLAQKLNQLNDMEQSLHEKEKEMKEEKFYIQKQWEELQESKKSMETPQPAKKQPRIFKSQFVPSSSFREDEINPYSKVEEDDDKKKKKDPNSQILKYPLRKLVKHHQSEIYDFSLNYNGNWLASCGGDRAIKVLDVNSMRVSSTINSHSPQNVYISVALDYSGERLLAGSTDKGVSIFNSQTGKHLHSFLGHGSKVNSVCWTSSRQRCVSGSEDKQLKMWDIEKASNVFSVSCGKGVKVIKSNNVEPVVYTGHADGSLRVYSVTQGNAPVTQIKGLIDYSISSLTLLSNRNQVLVTSLEGSVIHLLDLKMNKSVGKYEHPDFFNSSAHGTISPSESMVLSGNCDGSIYYWNKFKGDMVKRVTGHESAVTAINYHFMSSILASGDKEGSLILWQ